MKTKQPKNRIIPTVDTQTRITKRSLAIIQDIAEQLFLEQPLGHKRIKVFRPSSKVALDYLIVTATMAGKYKIRPLNPKNNLYLAVEEPENGDQ